VRHLLVAVPRLHFASLRGQLFAAFVAVLLLSLALTAGTFWVQIRLYDTQQVQSELQAVAPTVFTTVKNTLVRYWQTAQTTNSTLQVSLQSLRAAMAASARAAGVRVVLVDYCNHIAIDTGSTVPLVALPSAQVQSACSPLVDDAAKGPRVVDLEPNSSLTRQTTNLPGGRTFYLAFAAPSILAYAAQETPIPPLLVRTIIIAKSPAGVDQNALSSILPRLVAAGIFAVILSLLVVLLIVRAVTRPLRSITMASERMARGDYDQRVPVRGTDEVGQLAESFNRMASEVSAAREMQRQFIANVSHDLKTPLTSILGFSQILADSEQVAADPTQRRAVQVIFEEARRLQRLTLDLLDLSRLEAHQLQLRHGACDVNDLAGQVFGRYAQLPANAALHFLDERVAGPLWVWGDADRLIQVLVNLLDNAVKFCDPGGRVAIHTQRRDDQAVLTVANTGAGIAAEDLTRVFQRFYRTDHSRATRTGGTGLGLAIVRELVSAHGGQVEARSGGDGWTRFVVSLPLMVGAIDPPPLPLEEPRQTTGGRTDTGEIRAS
jgi:signal transduction histidine kinase